jgi:hypothetical protein
MDKKPNDGTRRKKSPEELVLDRLPQLDDIQHFDYEREMDHIRLLSRMKEILDGGAFGQQDADSMGWDFALLFHDALSVGHAPLSSSWESLTFVRRVFSSAFSIACDEMGNGSPREQLEAAGFLRGAYWLARNAYRICRLGEQ